MERISKHIAQRFIDLLPEDKQYYKLGELRQLGFPPFVVKRVQVELERNLAESIVPPKTDWANMQTNAVQNAWNQFISAIRAEARLPASYAHPVVETAVDDIMEMLVQPRKNLPEVIFGAADELDYEEVLQRMDSIVVYRHFATLIPKYMEKKGLQKLGKERCALLVEKADKKLTEHYTPLNWAQMLEPLFNLLDEQIDSNLLRLFFEDKKMPRVARSFDLMNKTLNRAQLIEVLSSPELLNFEGYDEEQSELFQQGQQPDAELKEFMGPPEGRAEEAESGDSLKEKLEAIESGSKKGKEKKKNEEKEEPDETAPQEEQKEEEPAEDPDSILSKFHEGREKPAAGLRNVDSDSLNTVFDDLKQEEKDERRKKGEEEQRKLRREEAKSNSEGEEEESSLNEIFTEEADLDIEHPEVAAGEDTELPPIFSAEGETGESPMWQRFLSPEEQAEEERLRDEEKSGGDENENEDDPGAAAIDDEGFIEEPIIDLTKDEEPDQSEMKRLNELLDDERERFVEEIFRGADEAYEDAVQNIASFEDWRAASKYIEKEVFKRNLVDMYSEVAVDFTDRLHTYYIEKSKSKS